MELNEIKSEIIEDTTWSALKVEVDFDVIKNEELVQELSPNEINIKDECEKNKMEIYIKDEFQKNQMETNNDNSNFITGYKEYECEKCNYKTLIKSYLVKHIQRHTGDKKYKCHLCEYKCLRKEYLTRHIKTHTDDKKHECHLCEYKSMYKRNLDRHMKTHSVEKKYKSHLSEYKCHLCEYTSRFQYNLTRHIERHTSDKVYQCEQCTFKTSLKSYLVTHIIRNHTGDEYKKYACHLCESNFLWKYCLSQHILTHTNVKAYQCDKCTYKTGLKSYLVKHIQKHR